MLEICPLTIRSKKIELTHATQQLIYDGCGLLLEAEAEHAEVALQLLSEDTAVDNPSDFEIFFDAPETPEGRGNPVCTIECRVVRLSAPGLLVELRGLKVRVSAAQWAQWRDARSAAAAPEDAEPANPAESGMFISLLRAAGQSVAAQIFTHDFVSQLKFHVSELTVLFHGDANQCTEVLPYRGSIGLNLSSLECFSRELQADELQAAGTGWALFVYTIQNLPLAGRLGTISAWMLHKDSVGPSGFLVSRSPDEECAVSLGLCDY